MPNANTTPALTPVLDHQDRVASLLAPTPVQSRPVVDCLGLALAEDLVSTIPLPPFRNSAMDGYAVRTGDLAGATGTAPVTLPVVEDVPAGRTDSPPLNPGTAHRIMTGAQVPDGADAVVPVERTDGGTERVAIHLEPEPGANIRGAGEDVAEGSVVLTAGTTLGCSQLGVAAAVGASHLPVHRPPSVLVLSTGSELVAPGTPLRPGQIYESNGLMLTTAVRQAGCHAELLRFVPDDVEALHSALSPHLDSTDLILTSGGVSAGAYEVVKDAFSGKGVEFTKVAVQPGMPQGAGHYLDTAVVTLPGNPVSAMVSFEVFVRPALLRAAGHTTIERTALSARLTESLTSPSGKRQYRRGRFDPTTATVAPQGGPGSHLLAALAGANCLLEIPEETSTVPAGAEVRVLLLD